MKKGQKRIEGDTLKPGTSPLGTRNSEPRIRGKTKTKTKTQARTLGFPTLDLIEPLRALVQFCVF